MHRGYVKLWRKSLEDTLWQNWKVWRFFEYCLMKASHKECDVMVGMQVVHLEPGQFVFKRPKAVKETGLSARETRTSLELLKNIEKVTSRSTNKFTVISVVNWDHYQSDEIPERPTNDQQTTNKRPTNTFTPFNNKNKHTCAFDAKCTNDFAAFWNAYPKKRNKQAAMKAWKKLNGTRPPIDVILAAIDAEIQSADWQREDGRFIPLPSSWLNGQRWEDEVYQPTETLNPPSWKVVN